MYKIIILGVGNSGTRLLGTLVSQMLKKDNCSNYYYEPLYWDSNTGEKDISISYEGIYQHNNFPLFPAKSETWPWLEDFVTNMDGVAKFIRAGSRVYCFPPEVKIIWIVRELYSYLGSMKKNFPGCLPNSGWHHRPGKYDDFERIQLLYPEYSFSKQEKERVVVESAWWHLHNSQLYKYADDHNIFFLRYENLCKNPVDILTKLANWAEIPVLNSDEIPDMKCISRSIELTEEQFCSINTIAGSLNKQLYQNDTTQPIIVS